MKKKNCLYVCNILLFILLLSFFPYAHAAASDASSGEPENIKEQILLFVDGLEIIPDVQPIIEQGRVLVPMRALFEVMQAQILWNNETKTVTATRDGRTLELTVDQREGCDNGGTILLDVPPRIIGSRVFIPLRFVGEFWDIKVNWDNEKKSASLSTGLATYQYLKKEFPISSVKKNEAENAENGTFSVGVHVLELSSSLIPKVSLAYGQVGKATALHNFASYYKEPVAVINGTYFNSTGQTPDPYGIIITNGEIVHIGNEGTTIGFTNTKTIKIDSLEAEIKGTVKGYNRPVHNWSAFGMNHTPSPDTASIYLFTRARGNSIGFNYGTSVIVDRNGTILDRVKNVDAEIPPGGFVLNFTGYLELEALRFIPGMEAEYTITLKNKNGKIVNWSDVKEAFTCWPLIMKEGRIVVPTSKVPANRSVLAFRADGRIILLNSTPATLEQLAQILKEELDAYHAINLDGGGSAGLYFQGRYLIKPSRLIPNALVFCRN